MNEFYNVIYLKNISEVTATDIANIIHELDPNQIELEEKFRERRYITVHELAPLWFVLRQSPDTPNHFPKGKWAVLQHLENLIDNACKQPLTADLDQDIQNIARNMV